MIRFLYQVMVGCRYLNDTVLVSGYGWLKVSQLYGSCIRLWLVVGISIIRFLYQVMVGCRYLNDTVLVSGYGWL